MLLILIVVVVGLGIAMVAARQIRRNILSKRDFAAGTAAYDKQDWVSAYRHSQEYLGRNPDDLEILKKYAEARLSVRPTEPGHLSQAMAAYRPILQLDPCRIRPTRSWQCSTRASFNRIGRTKPARRSRNSSSDSKTTPKTTTNTCGPARR